MENNNSTLLDVLSGKEPIKAEVSLSSESIVILATSVLFVFILSVLFYKKIKG